MTSTDEDVVHAPHPLTECLLRERRRARHGIPVRIEMPGVYAAHGDATPHLVARLFDSIGGSEWAIDSRRVGSHVQVRAVEYASDGLWMPHVWRDVPEGSTVYFVEGQGIEVRPGVPGRESGAEAGA